MAKFVGKYVYFAWPSGRRNPVFRSIIKVQSIGTAGSLRSIGKFELFWFERLDPTHTRPPRAAVAHRLRSHLFTDERFLDERQLISNILDGMMRKED